MKKLLFQSNVGIQFNQEIHHGFCFVKVQTKTAKRAYTLKKYIFPNVELSTSSPFLSWENLNCCNGWKYDEAYLLTAVQEGKKLYAGCSILMSAPGQAEDAESRFHSIKASLPETCTAGKDILLSEFGNGYSFPFYICRKGCLKDFYDLEQILDDYKRLGIHISSQDRDALFGFGNIELEQFSTGKPFCYFDYEKTDAELIATGLLLGYPLESTASIFMGN